MRFPACVGLILATCSLAACGGGSPVLSTPTPTPTPTPSTPAPTNDTLVNLQYSQSFEGTAAINPFTVSRPSGAASGGSNRINRSISVRYDAASRAYTVVHSDAETGTFTQANRNAAESTNVVTVYEKTSGNKTEQLALNNPGPANSEIALTYVTYGGWQAITDLGASLDVKTSFFVFGIPTTAAQLPKTGSATYQTLMTGQYADGNGVYVLGGSSSFAADFAAGTVSFGMDPLGQNVVDGSILNFGPVSGTGTINGLTSGFDASSGLRPAGTYSVDMIGRFFGPAAAEMGASFLLRGDSGYGNGVIVGKKP